MSIRTGQFVKRGLASLGLLLLASCSRAPSIEILGSYFPAWLLCLTLGILLTFLSRWFLMRLQIPVLPAILVYPSLTAMFTFALWLVFYG